MRARLIGVDYNHLISNNREWNNRLFNFFFKNSKRLVITAEFY